VRRLSVGVQGLDDERLRFLGRLHSADGAREAIRVALRSGAVRVSGDLIYAVAGQTPERAAREAAELADLGLRHVSAYALTIEPGTQFGELARRGRLPLADDALMVESFFAVDEALAARGLRHYELSNFAAPGHESLHNLGYWRGDDYVGLGCAAFGTVARAGGDTVRYRNLPEPRRYMDAALGGGDVVLTTEPLSPETRLRERIMLGLRLAEGLDLAAAAREVGAEAWTEERTLAAERLVARGRLRREGDRLSVPRDAWIWTDDCAAALF
jgi:coproporphyrinogen III oxidase-like Fe-S oxidoreductase